jgi:branched-chain amino acid transport system permease protein
LSSEIYIQLAISGLTTGVIYSLIALGFTTIYRSSNILNLAQGEFVVLGGLFTVLFLKQFHFPYLVAGAASVVTVTIIGFLIQKIIIRPARDEGTLILIMLTIGISVFLSGSSALLFGPSPQSLPPIIDSDPIRIFRTVGLNMQGLIVIGVTIVILVLLFLFSRFTYFGKAMEAVSTDTLGADLVGISRDFVVMISFGISAAVGAVAGILLTPLYFTQCSAGAILGLKGFSAAVIGGWGRYQGAVLGGVVLGLIESLSVAFIPAGWKDAIAFILLLLILYFRPKGILGSRALEESRK